MKYLPGLWQTEHSGLLDAGPTSSCLAAWHRTHPVAAMSWQRSQLTSSWPTMFATPLSTVANDVDSTLDSTWLSL